MPLQSYEMKDSGVEWIGEIPKAWQIKRIKSLALSADSLFLDGDWINSTDISDAGIRYFTTGNVGQGFFKEQGNGYITSETFSRLACTMVHADDLIISRLNEPVGRACIIPKNYQDCIVAVDNVILRPDKGYDKKYLMYCMSSDRYAEYTALLARGTTMPRISRTQLGNIFLPIPSFVEQQSIAAYLDEKCAAIDEIIAEAKATIDEYKSWKASVVFEAVTKGLNPNAEMKDSGVEWIGRIPKHWPICKIKYLCSMQAGKNLTSEDIQDSGTYPVYGGNGLRGYYSSYNQNRSCLLVGRQGALCGNVHYVSGKFWATDHAVVTIPSSLEQNRHLYYLLVCMNLNQYALNTAAQPGLSVTLIQNLPTLLTPITEQTAIAAYLDEKCAAIDGVIAEKEALIGELESYKKSLIFETVTGKRRVC